MDAVTVNINNRQWQPAKMYPIGTEEKVLSAGDETTPRAIVLKLPPGWSMDGHSHLFTELHFVLEGQYESQGEIYPAGTFCLIPEGVEHGPYSSESGAVIMITWCKMKK